MTRRNLQDTLITEAGRIPRTQLSVAIGKIQERLYIGMFRQELLIHSDGLEKAA
jgi:hypothetical protein